jgi:hypothetical protein
MKRCNWANVMEIMSFRTVVGHSEVVTMRFACMDRDDRGFSARIDVQTQSWQAWKVSYFLDTELEQFVSDLRSMHRGSNASALFLSHDEETAILIAMTPSYAGRLGVKIVSGRALHTQVFEDNYTRMIVHPPVLVFATDFIDIDRSYLETFIRDVGQFRSRGSVRESKGSGR